MKKILFLCFSVLFTNFIWSQVTVSAPSSVEVGLNSTFGFTFLPSTDIPAGSSSYKLTSWFINCGSSNMNNSGYGSYSNNSESLYTYGIGQSQNIIFPIKWEDNSNSLTADISITTNVTYYGVDGNGNTFQTGSRIHPNTYTVNINRIFIPTITNTTFAACSTANVKICATNYATANQFNWVITGGTITSGQGTSCVNVTPTLTGSLTASCTAKRSAGLSSYTRTATKTINHTPFTSSATITGNAFFCTSSNYSINGLLPNQTVQWSLSKPPLFGTLSSTTGSSTIVTAGPKKGEITLIAKILNSCGEFVTITKEITIGVNGINAVLTTPSGYPYSYPYHNVPENCSAPLYVFITSSENTNLNNPTKQMQFTCNGITVVKQPVANYYFFLYASDFNIDEGNWFDVDAKVGNGCGFTSGSTTFRLYRPTSCQCGIGSGCNQLPRMANPNNTTIVNEKNFKVYPNPSNDIIIIELENTTSTQTKSNASIYNILGTQVANFEIIEDKAIIDVKQFNKGVYILKINTDGKEENHQIIIK